PPARAAPAAGARAPAVLARRRRRGAERRLRLADRRLARTRAVRPDGHHLRRAPEHAAPDHGGRLGRPPAAQGLSDRRRAGPLLGRGMTIAPERVLQDWPIVAAPPYEGSRIPSPVPTILPVPEALRSSDDILRINFGPNHPST